MQHLLPEGCGVRRPTMDDVPAVVAMLRAKEMAERGRVQITETDLRRRWEAPTCDLNQDFWLFIAPDGNIAALCSMGRWQPTRLAAGLSVHPAYASLALYPSAIELALRRAHELVPNVQADARVTLNFTCSEKDIVAHQALEQAGFSYVRSDWLMQLEMDDSPPISVWPDNVVLRPYTPDLLRTVFEADDEAFQDHWGHVPGNFEAWRDWVVGRADFDPSLWFIAYAGEEIAGLALCGKLGEEAYVDNLAVRRPWRRKGLGLALLYHAFGEFYRRGERLVVLHVDSQNLTGATRLYARAGMRPVEQYDAFQLELRAGVELGVE
ncbi:MAG: GNAT family N-acetyltransferase [Ktedonobacteraceae bacterium]